MQACYGFHLQTWAVRFLAERVTPSSATAKTTVYVIRPSQDRPCSHSRDSFGVSGEKTLDLSQYRLTGWEILGGILRAVVQKSFFGLHHKMSLLWLRKRRECCGIQSHHVARPS